MDPQIERELQALAYQRGQPVAALVREALAQYVVAARDSAPRRLGFAAAGRSGRADVADRHEELLFEPTATPPAAAARPRPSRRAPARRRG